MASKREMERRKSWRYKLRHRLPVTWKKCIDDIDNEGIKVKAAAIAWWDFSGERFKANKESMDYLYTIHKRYRPYYELYYDREKLTEALIILGYPIKQAWARSKQPENKNGWEY